MLPKKIFVYIIGLSLLFVYGCEATKGFTKGLKQDVENTWEHVKTADQKFKENWW